MADTIAARVSRIIAGGALFAALAGISTPALSAAVLALVGLCGGMVMSLIVSNLQVHAPIETRGRILAMYSMSSQVMPALSGVLAGIAVNAVGLGGAIAGSGIALAMIAVLASIAMPSLRRHSGLSVAEGLVVSQARPGSSV